MSLPQKVKPPLYQVNAVDKIFYDIFMFISPTNEDERVKIFFHNKINFATTFCYLTRVFEKEPNVFVLRTNFYHVGTNYSKELDIVYQMNMKSINNLHIYERPNITIDFSNPNTNEIFTCGYLHEPSESEKLTFNYLFCRLVKKCQYLDNYEKKIDVIEDFMVRFNICFSYGLIHYISFFNTLFEKIHDDAFQICKCGLLNLSLCTCTLKASIFNKELSKSLSKEIWDESFKKMF